ncbi:MAG: cupredoxin domain-containing protein [Candidatus Magasanikbacteria bacterium]|nr:cupredoxin domain-containing protein [Candidatus Magasanikbacteria bacterium]
MQKKQLGLLAGTVTALMLMGAGCNSNGSINTTNQVQPTQDDQKNITTSVQQSNEISDDKIKQSDEKNDDKNENDNDNENEKEDSNPKVKVSASTTAEVKVPPVASQSPVKEFTITAKDWKFTPGNITVKKGDKVRLKITSVDVEHSFVLKDYNLNVQLDPGQTQVVEFIADKAGTFSFRCGVPCGEGHKEMTGTLTVQ